MRCTRHRGQSCPAPGAERFFRGRGCSVSPASRPPGWVGWAAAARATEPRSPVPCRVLSAQFLGLCQRRPCLVVELAKELLELVGSGGGLRSGGSVLTSVVRHRRSPPRAGAWQGLSAPPAGVGRRRVPGGELGPALHRGPDQQVLRGPGGPAVRGHPGPPLSHPPPVSPAAGHCTDDHADQAGLPQPRPDPQVQGGEGRGGRKEGGWGGVRARGRTAQTWGLAASRQWRGLHRHPPPPVPPLTGPPTAVPRPPSPGSLCSCPR